MKKIMFNDRYNLEWMVLKGKKTQTRRVLHRRAQNFAESFGESHPEAVIKKYARFQVGDVVAIAQSYEATGLFDVYRAPEGTAGWNNKMFVRADLMPHQIEITDVRLQRLQDISDEDCMAEGVWKRMRSETWLTSRSRRARMGVSRRSCGCVPARDWHIRR